MDDLYVDVAPLAASLEGEFVPNYALPNESALNAVHAQLARVAREQRRFTMVEVKTDG